MICKLPIKGEPAAPASKKKEKKRVIEGKAEKNLCTNTTYSYMAYTVHVQYCIFFYSTVLIFACCIKFTPILVKLHGIRTLFLQ